MTLNYLSASRIKTFEQCPYKYYATYDLKMPEPPPHPNTLMGSAVHGMLESAVNARIKGSENPEECNPLFWMDKFVKEFNVRKSLIPTIKKLVANAERWGYFRKIDNTKGCELEVLFNVNDTTKVKGFIDRLDIGPLGADIIDIKTQKREFESSTLNDNWQARIYNIGARELYPEIKGRAKVSFWVLRHRVQTVFLDAEDAKKDRDALIEVAEEIRGCTEPDYNPSGLCPYCPNHKECTGKNRRATDILSSMRL